MCTLKEICYLILTVKKGPYRLRPPIPTNLFPLKFVEHICMHPVPTPNGIFACGWRLRLRASCRLNRTAWMCLGGWETHHHCDSTLSCLGLAVVELAADGLLQHNSTVKEIGRKIVSHRREDDAFSSVHTVRPCVQWPIFKGDLMLAEKRWGLVLINFRPVEPLKLDRR